MSISKAIFIIAVILTSAYALVSNVSAQTNTVDVQIAEGADNVENSKFYVPARITIPVGTTVVWTNLDDAAHTVTDGTPTSPQWGTVFDSGIMRLGKVYKFTFNEVGGFPYLCALHPWMLGKVSVLPEGGSLVEEVVITATTDKVTYRLGDSVNIKGNVSPVIDGEAVVIEVINPNDARFRSDTISVKEDGTFSYDFKLKGDLALPGTYTVKVTYSDANMESMFVVEKGIGKPEVERGATDIRVVAKQVKDIILIRVKNADDNASIYGITVQIPNSIIEAFKGPRDWSKPDTTSNEAISSTSSDPIEPGEKAIFKLKIQAHDIVMSWTVYDDDNNILDQGEVKPISFKRK